MKYMMILGALFVSVAANGQKAYTTSKDKENGSVVYKGLITFSDLSAEPTFTWLKKGKEAYKPDSNAVGYLRRILPGYTIVTVMGTWCEDSQNLIPKLAKTLDEAQVPQKQCIMYGVDRAKQTGGIEAQMYDIKRVPTIIVYKGQTEIGRIVESVKRSVETDLVQIIQKDAGDN